MRFEVLAVGSGCAANQARVVSGKLTLISKEDTACVCRLLVNSLHDLATPIREEPEEKVKKS